MPQFIKKPGTVKAERWYPPGDSQHVPGLFTIFPYPRGNGIIGRIYVQGSQFFQILTDAGYSTLSPGDWIVTVDHGVQFRMSPEAFDANYEPSGT